MRKKKHFHMKDNIQNKTKIFLYGLNVRVYSLEDMYMVNNYVRYME